MHCSCLNVVIVDSYAFVVSEINTSVQKYFELLSVSFTLHVDYLSGSWINSLFFRLNENETHINRFNYSTNIDRYR